MNSGFDDTLLTSFSYFNRYEIKSSIEANLILCFFENLKRSFSLAILPSSFITSQITELGFNFDNLDISTEASYDQLLLIPHHFLPLEEKHDQVIQFLSFLLLD